MHTDNAEIGNTIRELRRARKLSKADLSRMAGISVSHLEKIEAGHRKPGIKTYQKFLEIREKRKKIPAWSGVWLCPVGNAERHCPFYRPGI